MLKRLLIISLLFIAISPLHSFSEETKPRLKGSIVVTSETLITDNKAHTAIFEKNVIAKSAGMTLYADKMIVYYREDSGDVTKIEATGDVKLQKDAKLIIAQRATYYTDKSEVVFAGYPRAIDGKNVVTGTKMTYFINEDRFSVVNSKVFLKAAKDK